AYSKSMQLRLLGLMGVGLGFAATDVASQPDAATAPASSAKNGLQHTASRDSVTKESNGETASTGSLASNDRKLSSNNVISAPTVATGNIGSVVNNASTETTAKPVTTAGKPTTPTTVEKSDVSAPTTSATSLPQSTPTSEYLAKFGKDIYSVQSAINDMIAPNTQGMYPSLWVVSFPERGLNHVWGANTEGDPSTGSYAYVDMKIRASDLGPSGTGFNPYPGRTSLAEAGVGSGDIVNLIPWVVVSDAYQLRNTSTNTRVQVRNMFIYALLFDDTWVSGGKDSLNSHPNTYGTWHSIFLGPGMTSGNGDGHAVLIGTGNALSDGRIEPDGGSSLGSIGMGNGEPADARGFGLRMFDTYSWHFYPLSGFDRTRADLEQNFVGTLSCLETKLVLHDPNGPDDREQSAMLINVGADYYNVSRGSSYIGGAQHSRWKRITNDWQLACTTDIPVDALRKSLPPGFHL
ncbi:MAG: hypothetical protein ACOYNL_11150, partial [Rickettsiales bacterium]